MRAKFKKHILNFIAPGGTSRGVLHQKTSYFLEIAESGKKGMGEISILPKLSIDEHEPTLEKKIADLCSRLAMGEKISSNFFEGFPALKFGFETAQLDLANGGKKLIFDTSFSAGETGIPINGLIWMGEKDFMLNQIKEKLNTGFRCLKMKIGAINFETELEILKAIRKNFTAETLELRVDANGAFSPNEALKKLDKLHQFQIHSIEQPIKQNQWEEMKNLCKNTPFPIALDEELIGVKSTQINELLEFIIPQYIILKPSLIGGFKTSDEWIKNAEAKGIGWWLTSALEANVGLNAIAQYASSKKNKMPQGLGTGKVFSNNIHSPLEVIGDELWYKPEEIWENIF